MRRVSAESERFVDAVYRRLIFFRAAEQFGLAFLAASAFAILIDLLAYWQSMPRLPILFFCGGLGLFFGITLTIYRWPTRWFAVLEIDRQLKFNDLLSSATLSANQFDDDFSAVVRKMADAQCRQHSPGDVFLRRLNAQTWGGIAATIAIACTLCVIPMGLQKSQAMDANSTALTGGELEIGKSIPRINNPTSDSAWNADPASQLDQMTVGNSKPGDANHSIGKNGAGSGGGGSTELSPPTSSLKFDRKGAGSSGDIGDLAGGGGVRGRGKPTNQELAGSVSRIDEASKFIPGWHADSSANQPATGSPLPGSSHNPDEDADLIRDFFKPR